VHPLHVLHPEGAGRMSPFSGNLLKSQRGGQVS